MGQERLVSLIPVLLGRLKINGNGGGQECPPHILASLSQQ
jgi:hypothetical protein